MAELLVLGSGTGIPNPKRGAPGCLLNVENKNILLDSGAGTLQRLIRYSVTYHDIDYILYTHFHPDHIVDLASILFAARNAKNPRKKDLVVIGPKGLEDFYHRLLALYGRSIQPESYKVVLDEMDEGERMLDACRLRAKRLEHTEDSIGFRIELREGKSLAYSGDTDYCQEIISLAEGVDLLILECSAPDQFKAKGHLTPSLAGKIAEEARSKRLLLTHFYPICDGYPIKRQCRGFFKGKLILARDNMRVVL